MTEQGRSLPVKERSCGVLGPPLKILAIPKAKNHKGIGVGLRAAHGRSATTFNAPINAPPYKMRVVNAEWCT